MFEHLRACAKLSFNSHPASLNQDGGVVLVPSEFSCRLGTLHLATKLQTSSCVPVFGALLVAVVFSFVMDFPVEVKPYLVVLRRPLVKTRPGGWVDSSSSVWTSGSPVVLLSPSSPSNTISSSSLLLSSPCRVSPMLSSKARDRSKSSLILLFLLSFKLESYLFVCYCSLFLSRNKSYHRLSPPPPPPPPPPRGLIASLHFPSSHNFIPPHILLLPHFHFCLITAYPNMISGPVLCQKNLAPQFSTCR